MKIQVTKADTTNLRNLLSDAYNAGFQDGAFAGALDSHVIERLLNGTYFPLPD